MSYAELLVDGDFIGRNVESCIDLDFVGVDDFGGGKKTGGEMD